MFRRRRPADAGQEWAQEPEATDQGPYEELGDEELFDDEPTGTGPPAGVPRAEGGPWDAGEPYPVRDRVDFGSLLVPVGPEHEIQLVMAEQQGAWVTVGHGESQMMVQAFAAARRGALWDDVRAEMAAEVLAAGWRSEERRGSFGLELTAEVPVDPAQPGSGLRLVRWIGVDGPRWFLRALFSGPAAAGGESASVLEDVLRDIVVVRGDHPVPPRDILELRLPPEAQQAFEDQAPEENKFRTDLNPFERGPEFTETR